MVLYFLIIFSVYYIFVLALIYGWAKNSGADNTQKKAFKAQFISIIVAVRNEAKNIHKLFSSLESQSYPKELFEVIFIDDQSEDETASLIQEFRNKSKIKVIIIHSDININSSRSPKKAALTQGIEMARGNFILTTDGDCRMSKHWLFSMMKPFNDRVQLVSGPVVINPGNKLLTKIQSLEFASLIGSGGALISLNYPLMCNGANLAFRKSAFTQVGGYKGKDQFSSGDDVYLMHKIHHQFKNSICFNKSSSSIVYTNPVENFSELINQRRRWASKWNSYQLSYSSLLAVILFLHYLSFLGLIVVMIIYHSIIFSGIALIAIKLIIDFIFLKKVMKFCNLPFRIPVYLLTSLLYPFYALTIGIIVHFGKWNWKGRKYKI